MKRLNGFFETIHKIERAYLGDLQNLMFLSQGQQVLWKDIVHHQQKKFSDK
jgi:hypothetical protein